MKYIKLYEELNRDTMDRTYFDFLELGLDNRAYNTKKHMIDRNVKEILNTDIHKMNKQELNDFKKDLLNKRKEIYNDFNELIQIINSKLENMTHSLPLTYDNISDNNPIDNEGFYVYDKKNNIEFYGSTDYEEEYKDEVIEIDIDYDIQSDRIVVFSLYPENDEVYWNYYSLIDKSSDEWDEITDFKIKFGFKNLHIPYSDSDYRALALVYYD